MGLHRTKVMIHHSLTQDLGTVSWGAIRKYHKETKKWTDIGYHYGIELVNGQYEVLLGRPETWRAAACLEGEMNTQALHVCCVGNFDKEEPSAAMLEVLVGRLLLPILRRNAISPDAIVGHRDYAHYKSCPGTNFDLKRLRQLVWERMA